MLGKPCGFLLTFIAVIPVQIAHDDTIQCIVHLMRWCRMYRPANARMICVDYSHHPEIAHGRQEACNKPKVQFLIVCKVNDTVQDR